MLLALVLRLKLGWMTIFLAPKLLLPDEPPQEKGPFKISNQLAVSKI